MTDEQAVKWIQEIVSITESVDELYNEELRTALGGV